MSPKLKNGIVSIGMGGVGVGNNGTSPTGKPQVVVAKVTCFLTSSQKTHKL